MRLARAWPLAVIVALLPAGYTPADTTKPAERIRALIDQLARVDRPGSGYNQNHFYHHFFPVDEGAPRFGWPQVRNDVAPVLRELVEHGAAAVPQLLEHLDDRRPTGARVNHTSSPTGGMSYEEDCDYNPRTEKKPDRGSAAKMKEEDQTSAHRLAVGDLCYVALGQIVNRSFVAARYQMTACIIVQSPPRSPALLAAVRRQWQGLTPEKHRASLVADFLKPDSLTRRIEAAKRLAFYYPDELEPLALKLLARPTYNLRKVAAFIENRLYPAKDAAERRRLLEEFVKREGEASRTGILVELFEKLGSEEHRALVKKLQGELKSRRVLVELFNKPADVKETDKPEYVDVLSTVELAHFIAGGLVHDDSPRLDRAVCDLLAARPEDDFLATCCMERLVGRGYDRDIAAFLKGWKLNEELNVPGELDSGMKDRLGWTPLHVACARDQLRKTQRLLREGAKVNARSAGGETPLHVAAEGDNLELIRSLLDAKADPNVKDTQGKLPVERACDRGHLAVVRLLVERGSDVPDVFIAAASGKVARLKELLDRDLKLVKAAKAGSWSGLVSLSEETEKWTPLHLASRMGHVDAVKLLLARKAPVMAADKHGVTPLHLAAEHGHAGIVRLLLAERALVDAPAETRPPPRLNYLSMEKVTPLHLAAMNGHAEVMNILLGSGARAEPVDSWGYVPLHWAAVMDRRNAVELLLKHGVDIDRGVDANRLAGKETALEMAISQGHLDLVALLLKHNASTKAEWSLVEFAKSKGEPAIAALLEKHGAR